MDTPFHDPRLQRMAEFLGSIGIRMTAGRVEVPTVFPGSLIAHGKLVIDESKLVAPGDALHEAAHIALAPPERRESDFAQLAGADGGEELTTIAWCWAALLAIGLEPEEVFHGTAYPRGDSPAIIAAAERGVFIGFPLLQVGGMAFDETNARAMGVAPFPHMVRWLRG
jgi:hypothetical protein